MRHGLRIAASLGGDIGRYPRVEAPPTNVTIVVGAESRDLYEDAARALGWTIEERPAQPSYQPDPETRERMALRSGEESLRAIRKFLRGNNLDDPQRAYWREAQRRHRAGSRNA
jgi:hypothetical protein